MEKYLIETLLLNYSEKSIQDLIKTRNWNNKSEDIKIKEIYDYVRNEIAFGYNKQDDIKASDVLKEGIGQCNTKSILFMALLRGAGIPCRIHGFYIDKKMQKGALTGIVYELAPEKIVHAWTEVYYKNKWIVLEGIIIDEPFYNSVKNKLKETKSGFCGYAVATKDKSSEAVCFKGESTFIQSEAITQDLGIYDSPDDLFKEFNNNLKGFRKFIYSNILRKNINKRINELRKNL